MTHDAWRWVVALLLLTAVSVAFLFLPVAAFDRALRAWVEDLGDWGLVVLALAYIPASVLLIPGSLITLTGGALFGLVRGTIAISLGSTAGACVAFWAGRTVLRAWVEKKIAERPLFQRLDAAVAEQGFKLVLLTRLSPIFPFTLLNYAFSLTRVRFRDYLLASWVGMLPGTVMYVYLGSLTRHLAERAAGTSDARLEQDLVYTLGLAATVAVTVIVTRLARRALTVSLPAEPPQLAAPASAAPTAPNK